MSGYGLSHVIRPSTIDGEIKWGLITNDQIHPWLVLQHREVFVGAIKKVIAYF